MKNELRDIYSKLCLKDQLFHCYDEHLFSERCPPLLTDDYGKLILSSSSNAVGVTVEFLCADENETLSGPGVLRCLDTGVWNGTLPECIPMAGMIKYRILPYCLY